MIQIDRVVPDSQMPLFDQTSMSEAEASARTQLDLALRSLASEITDPNVAQ
jgi:hypothetical protein